MGLLIQMNQVIQPTKILVHSDELTINTIMQEFELFQKFTNGYYFDQKTTLNLKQQTTDIF
ncbi:hypothetical protein pb186bvf_001764 [Paramecium bursaria]